MSHRPTHPRRLWRLLSLRVRVCLLCSALVLDDNGSARHALWHEITTPKG